MAEIAPDGIPFGGAKIAMIADGCILTLKRDDMLGLPHPGLWDLPGGGREGGETPLACALRELHEEFGLRLDPARIEWRRFYPADPGAWFFGARWPGLGAGDVRFGSEGQGWALMPLPRFLARGDVVPGFQDRVRAFLMRA